MEPKFRYVSKSLNVDTLKHAPGLFVKSICAKSRQKMYYVRVLLTSYQLQHLILVLSKMFDVRPIPKSCFRILKAIFRT